MRGVKKSGNKYTSKVTCKGVEYYLGTFNTEEEAYTAYLEKKLELSGKYLGKYETLQDVFIYKDGYIYNKHTGHRFESTNTDGYIEVRFNREKRVAHRVIWELIYGDIPEGYFIDHIDGNKSNNNIENLRIATPAQNSANIPAKDTTLPKGVTKVGFKYKARIHYMYKNIYLGTFNTAEEAAEAYNAKSIELHGEFAFCNRS